MAVTTYPTITDDELLALVLSEGDTYRPTVLPTVDVDDPNAVKASALRGQRSLGVRDLADSDSTSTSAALSELGGYLRDVRPVVSLFVGDWGLRRRTFLMSNLWRRMDDERWLRQLITPVGTHTFVIESSSTMLDGLASLVVAAYDQDSPAGGPVLCVAVSKGDDAQILGVGTRRAEVAAVDSDAFPVEQRRSIVRDSLESALRTLVTSASA